MSSKTYLVMAVPALVLAATVSMAADQTFDKHFDAPSGGRLTVELKTSGGSIDVRNLNASAHGKTSGGGDVLQDITGTIVMRTSGGSIDAQHITGPAELTSSGGSIEIKEASGGLKAHTSGGGIEAQARCNQGISLETSGGGITLRLPADVHGTLDAKTSGGRVHSDFPVLSNDVGDTSHVQGTINGGGDSIYLHTSGGSIHIESHK